MVDVAHSLNGVRVRLTEERWRHIRDRHPEIDDHGQVLDTIRSPDIVQAGDFGAHLAIRKLDRNYLIVVYRELSATDGFVITAYMAERLRERATLWTR